MCSSNLEKHRHHKKQQRSVFFLLFDAIWLHTFLEVFKSEHNSQNAKESMKICKFS